MRCRSDYQRLRLGLQYRAPIQCRRVAGEVFFNSGQYLEHVWVEAIHLVLALPFGQHKPAIQQASKVVGDSALLKSELLSYLPYVVRPTSE